VIEKRCGRIDNHIEAHRFDPPPRCTAAQTGETLMYANAMKFLDQTAMIFVVILAAAPMLSIAARAAFL